MIKNLFSSSKKIAPFLLNKYALSSICFLLWLLFFDDRDIINTISLKSKLKDLQTKKNYYTEQIQQAQTELAGLQNSPETLEKFAREKYKMKKDGEDLFIIDDSVYQKNMVQ